MNRETVLGTVERLLERGTDESLRIELVSLRVKRTVLRLERPDEALVDDSRYRALCDRTRRLERRAIEHHSGIGPVPADD